MRKRLLSLLLCGALALGLWPLSALAAEGETPPEPSCTVSEDCPATLHQEGCPKEIPVEEVPEGETPAEPPAQEPPEEQPPTKETPPEPEVPAEPEVPELSPAQQVQALIDALPEPEDITADNAQEVAEQLAAIDEAKAALSDEELDSLDPSRYRAAAEVLATLAGKPGENSPQALVDPTGDFTVTGGSYGMDYVYADGELTVRTGTPLTIRNSDPSTPTTDVIVIANTPSSPAYVTLDGVNIDVSGTDKAAMMALGSGAKITLAEGSENILKSGDRRCGLEVARGSLTINGPGFLEAYGGDHGCGIGSKTPSPPPITITGGTIKAYGGDHCPGIGNDTGGNITITGGEITAQGGANCSAIGGPGGSNTSISNAAVTATSGRDYTDPPIKSSTTDWQNSVITENGTATLYGTYTGPLTLEGMLVIQEDQTLDGQNITNNGTIYVLGTLQNAKQVGGSGALYFPLYLSYCEASGDVVFYNGQLLGRAYSTIQLSCPNGIWVRWKDDDGNVDTALHTFTMPARAMTVTAILEPFAYTVTIPATIDFAQQREFQITAEAVLLPFDKRLRVAVTGADPRGQARTPEGASVSYKLEKVSENASAQTINVDPAENAADEQDGAVNYPLVVEGRRLTETGGSATIRVSPSSGNEFNFPYAGTYSSTLTFTVYIHDKPS